MAKTIRSHPTSPFYPPRTNLLDYSYIFKMWTQNGPTFSSFPNLPTSKKTTSQRKKDAHGPSLHIRFLSKCHFWYCIYHHVLTFWSKPTFLNYCHILIILCISDSNIGDPILLLFQSRTLIPKLEPYPKGISIFYPWLGNFSRIFGLGSQVEDVRLGEPRSWGRRGNRAGRLQLAGT